MIQYANNDAQTCPQGSLRLTGTSRTVGTRFWEKDLVHDVRHVCTCLRSDGTKAMSRGFLWGKQVEKFPMQEIVVEFVYSRQQKIKHFSS